jgi:thioredoxin-like negative regulator of GroEL
VEDLPAARAGQVALVRVHVDATPNLPLRYGVTALPALALFLRGQPAGLRLGDPADTLEPWLDACLGGVE